MKRLVLYGILYCLCICFEANAQDCYRIIYVPEESTIAPETTFTIQNDSLYLNGNSSKAIYKYTFVYDEFIRLKAHFKCIHPFDALSHIAVYSIDTYDTEMGELSIVNSTLDEVGYMVLDGVFFLIADCSSRLCYDILYQDEELVFQEYYEVKHIDSVYIESDVTFETVTEEVLVKDSYDTLTISSASHQEQEIVIETNQVGTCDSLTYTYETVIDSFIIKERYCELEIIPAVFEEREEYVLDHESYEKITDHFLLSDSIKIDTILTHPSFVSWDIEGLNISSENPIIATSFIPRNVEAVSKTYPSQQFYGSCPDGYDRYEVICKKTIEVPAKYSSRTYQKLVQNTTVECNPIPDRYKYYTRSKIIQTGQIPEGCIERTYDTLSFEKLHSPANSVRTAVPTAYGTRTYLKVNNPDPIISIQTTIDSISIYKKQSESNELHEVICYDSIDENLISKISQKLIEKGVPIQEKDYPHSDFWVPLMEFQKENGLLIGRISESLLEFLDVE